MRRGVGGGGRRLPKSSMASSSAAEGTPSANPLFRNLEPAFSRRDSDAASLCSSRPPSSIGKGPAAGVPNYSDRATQAAALRVVNAFLDPDVTLRPPLPAARDILTALRILLQRIHVPLQEKEPGFEDELIHVLRALGCPYKLTRSALKAPGTPHSWPPLLSVLHWLTIFASVADHGASAPFNDLTTYATQGYVHFISGDDDAVAGLDGEYVSKARSHAEAAAEATLAMERETQELMAKRNQLTSGPSRLEALETEKKVFTADVHKFEAVVRTWTAKLKEKEELLIDMGKELEAKVMDGQRVAAENQELLKKVETQAVNVRDVDRVHREMQAMEFDITNMKNEKARLEEKNWELEAALVRKLEDLEGIAEQCNQALKRLKLGIDFQYMLNPKGSSPAEILGLSYKSALKPALMASAEENKRVSVSKLDESVDLKKQLQGSVQILEERRNIISSVQAETDEMLARLNSVDREIANDDLRCAADAKQIKDEFERKDHRLSTLEMEADNFLKNSEQRLQDALRKADEETQTSVNDLLQLVASIKDYKEFMATAIAKREKDLYETVDYIASLSSRTSSTSKSSADT